MIALPPSAVGAGKIGALVIAQELTSEIGGFLGEIAAPGTLVGAMILSYRLVDKARANAMAISRDTADDALERLAADQARWDARETALLAEIERLRTQLKENTP